VEKAFIYADELMSSPVGYVSRGKKVRIGERTRNHDQVYPIVVSGKVAFIKASDINKAVIVGENKNFLTERFQNSTKEERIETTFALSFNQYQSVISLDAANGEMEDQGSVSWRGFSLRGSGLIKEAWEFQVLTNYYLGGVGEEELRILETGAGVGYRFINFKNFYTKVEAQFLYIPWASYSLGEDFRVNGSGYSTGLNLGLGLRFGSHFGVEAYGGAYYTKLGGFAVPPPYSPLEAIFVGTRMGVGLNYTF
jgi:hypothetical protein